MNCQVPHNGRDKSSEVTIGEQAFGRPVWTGFPDNFWHHASDNLSMETLCKTILLRH